MDLVIAVQQLAAIINIRAPHRATAGEGDRAGRTFAGAGVTAAGVRAAHAVLERNPVAGRDAIPEVDQVRIGARGTIQLGEFRRCQHPDADAIAVRYAVRFPICSLRVIVAGLAAVLDVNTEQDSPRCSATLLALPIAHTGEGDLVRGRFAWLRSGRAIARIADAVDHRSWAILTTRAQVRVQARAVERVKEPGMEVALVRISRVAVPNMRPATMDARIAQEVVGQAGVNHTNLVAHWRANLAAMRHVTDISRAHKRRVLSATTGHPANGRSHAANQCRAFAADNDVRAGKADGAQRTGISAVGEFCGLDGHSILNSHYITHPASEACVGAQREGDAGASIQFTEGVGIVTAWPGGHIGYCDTQQVGQSRIG